MAIPFVVMRARNDMPLIRDTLAALSTQHVPHRLLVFDNASTDGSREAAAAHGATIIDVPEGAYVPGRVLNEAMHRSEGDIVTFVNADCTPVGRNWLGTLLSGFDAPDVAAVFGRQDPRPLCHPLWARDTLEAYGDGARQQRWRCCFSMAASAIRRDVWRSLPFDEALRYSEDIDWTWRARQRGFLIRYAAEARATHSHNYTPGQLYRRQHGEGKAEAHIFPWSRWRRSLIRYAVLPYARQVVADLAWCIRERRLGAAAAAPLLRLIATTGRWRGFIEGLREESSREIRTTRHA